MRPLRAVDRTPEASSVDRDAATGPIPVDSTADRRPPRADSTESERATAQPTSDRSARSRIRAAARERKRDERAEVRRFTVASRRRRRNWLIAGGALLGMIGIVAAVAFSPVTAVRVIQVEGASRVPAASIVTALGDQLGTPLALVDEGAVHRALSTFTLIQSYSVEAHPPDTLVVRIVERDPVGSEKTASGYDLVDSAGVVISSTPDRPAGYPVLVVTTPRALAAAGEVVRSLPADVRAQLDQVRAETKDDVTLTLTTGPTVVWGSAEDSVLKAAVFARLVAAAPGATRYDVSSPSNPVDD